MTQAATTGLLPSFLQAARERAEAGAYGLDGPALRPNGRLADALRAPGAVIAELKPRSPGEGRLLVGPAAPILAAYKEGGAAALSVLTDATHFGGSPGLLREAHATGLPTLMKDLVVDERQLDCAAHAGASAILLIERCFTSAEDREAFVAAAHRRGLEVLLELFTVDEAKRAATSRADIVGVNARDLGTLKVDVPAALALVKSLAAAGRPVVALSGIDGRAADRRARAAGAMATLVGTHLMRSPDPGLALRALRRPLAKVCGLRAASDVEAAAQAGADLAGLVVGSPGSPREVTPFAAHRLADEARARGLRPVLVTRTTDPALLLEWCRLVRPAYLQAHGAVPSADLRHRLAAFGVHVLAAVEPGAPAPEADGVVVDTRSAGGSGAAHAWATVPTTGLSLIAGGLDAGNAAAALAASGAWGADASSRLESAPGVKDPDKVAAFVKAVHSA